MIFKGNISIIIEFVNKEWDAKPIGFSFGNFFFGIVLFGKRKDVIHE